MTDRAATPSGSTTCDCGHPKSDHVEDECAPSFCLHRVRPADPDAYSIWSGICPCTNFEDSTDDQ